MKRVTIVRGMIISVVLGLIPLNVWAQNSNETTTTTGRSKLKIAVPVREFSHQFVMVGRDPTTGNETYTGFAIDVFQAVMATLASPPSYEFVAFKKPDGTMNGSFDNMLQAVSSEDYDGAVGDISILYHRTGYVDFTMPYMESYITMLVPIKPRSTTTASGRLSLIQITEAIVIVTFCVSTIVTIYFALTPLLRRMKPNDGRKANLGWTMPIILLMLSVFIVLVVLNACYIVSKASSGGSGGRSGSIKNLSQLMRMGSNVGYREGSFVYDLLLIKGFPKSKLMSLKSEEEMVEMLSKGSSKGGVDAIVANAPHLKLLQSNHCRAFTTVPTTNLQATGFGFAFGKRSSIVDVDEVSRGILKIVDNGQLGKIQDRTIGSLDTCNDDSLDVDDASLYFPSSHTWMLIIGGVLAGLILIISLVSHSLLF